MPLPPAESDRLHVVLVAARNPLNIGAAARAMSNFGFTRLRVVNPYALAFREARSAVGADDVLMHAEEFETVADAVADCTMVVGTTAAQNRELRQPLQGLEDAGAAMRRALQADTVALVFGSEKRGLSNQDLSHCHLLVRIPTRDEHSSMNLGQAVAVCLYEIARGGSPGETTGTVQGATSAEIERLTGVVFESLRLSGYADQQRAASVEDSVRRLMHRMHLSADDANLWLGMLRKIRWKLSQTEEQSNIK